MCIILIVALHTSDFYPPVLRMLPVPLFFVLSGLFFKEYGGYVRMLIKKINSILIPFLFFYLGAYLVHEVKLLLTHIDSPDDIIHPILFINFSYGAIWFLLVLFWQHLIFGAIVKASKKWIVRASLVVVVACAGWACNRQGISLPCLVVLSMTNLPFFYLGYLLKQTPILYPNKFDRFNIAMSVALIGIAFAIYYLCDCPVLNFINNNTNLWIVEICGCASFVMAALLLCKIIKRIPIVSYLGRYSLVVLCIHIHVYSRLAPILDKVDITFPFCNTLITLLVCLCLIPLFVRFLPWFVAQKGLIPMPKERNPKPQNAQ